MSFKEFEDAVRQSPDARHKLREMGFTDLNQLFHMIDGDGSGEVDLEEFSKAMAKFAAHKPVAESAEDDSDDDSDDDDDKASKAFKQIDKDNSGFMSFKEFEDAVRQSPDARHKLREMGFTDLNQLFHMIDGDGSGEVDLEEFSKAMAKFAAHKPVEESAEDDSGDDDDDKPSDDDDNE